MRVNPGIEVPPACGTWSARQPALPFIPRADRLPDRPSHRRRPCRSIRATWRPTRAVTGLRYRDAVPLTLPVRPDVSPRVMELITGFDFPFPAIGRGARRQRRSPGTARSRCPTPWACGFTPRTCANTAGAAGRRRHRRPRGQRARVASDHDVPAPSSAPACPGEPKPRATRRGRKLPPPNAILRITPRQIRRYAAIGGDRNPIHTSAVGAKLFGFPDRHRARNVQRRSGSGQYRRPAARRGALHGEVRQAGPCCPPAWVCTPNACPGGWDVALRNMPKGLSAPHCCGARAPLRPPPEQVDQEFRGFVDVGVTDTDPPGDRLSGARPGRPPSCGKSVPGSGCRGTGLQQSGDEVDDLPAALPDGVGERLGTGGLGVEHDPRRPIFRRCRSAPTRWCGAAVPRGLAWRSISARTASMKRPSSRFRHAPNNSSFEP